MLKKGKPQPNLLADVDPELDCQVSEETTAEPGSAQEPQDNSQDHDDDGHAHNVTWRDVGEGQEESPYTIEGWIPDRAGLTIFLERIALAVERPANRLIGTAQLNPFYHTGTIATLLLIVVALTGFFLFLFSFF